MPAPARPILDSATIALFFLGLAAPAIDQCLRPDGERDTTEYERHRPEPRPPFPRTIADVAGFPRRFESHYMDTFGLRDVLLRWNSIEQWLGLGVSPSDLVEHAPDGWCFLLAGSREAHRGLSPFSEQDLQGWVERLRERRDFLASQGARYLFVICPSKDTIYPERTPATWNKLGPTRLEQLFARLEREGDIPFLDLRPALMAAKADDLPEDWVYTRFGTHWNGRGGYAAYQAILARLELDFPDLERVPRDACRVVEREGGNESLGRQLYIRDLVPQRLYCLRPADREPCEVLHASAYTMEGRKLVTRKDIAAPRLLWLHDSFGTFLDDLMCASFSFVQAHWTDEFLVDSVSEARPDVVLETYSELKLVTQKPYGPIDTGAAAPDALFEQFTDVAWRLDEGFSPPQAFGRATLERHDGALELALYGLGDGLLVPELDLAPDSLALLRIAADCSEPTEIDVLVRPAGATSFRGKDHVRSELGPDAPAVVLRLPFVGPRFDVLIRHRAKAKGLGILALEVRRGRAPGP